jgi:predicted GIY-YIG superfamily endonuclease/predicted Zn-ribbon and HTH transcriptional regulator
MRINFSDSLWNQSKIAGVYMIFDCNDVPVYCGQSSDIKSRLGNHRKWVGVGYYAEVILFELCKRRRMEFEELYHDISHDKLLSKATNGNQEKCSFDGRHFGNKTDMYTLVSSLVGASNSTVEKYIRDNGCVTIEQIKFEMSKVEGNLLASVPSSNTRRTGKKLNMKPKVCPHCGTEGKGGNMTRYHFDNCKIL